jgi:pyrophosphatase PpaX
MHPDYPFVREAQDTGRAKASQPPSREEGLRPTSPREVPIRTVLFDFDGTLVDTTQLILASFRSTWQAIFGFCPPDLTFVRTFGTHLPTAIDALIDQGVEEGLQAPPKDRRQTIEEVLQTYRRFNLAMHDEMIAPFQEIPELLNELREAGIRLAIVSSKMRGGVERGLRLFDLAESFELIVGAEDVKAHKPHPEPLERALATLGLAADEALYIGDSIHDIAAGRAAGLRTAAAGWGPFPHEELAAALPDYLLLTPLELISLPGLAG